LFFSLLSIYLFIRNNNLLSAIAFGLAVSSKWSAIYVLPILFFWGWAMFIFLFDSWLIVILASFLFFLVNYVILLVDNLFLVTVSYKAIPLYRTASSVNLLLVLSSSFLLFDVFGSFYLPFWLLASLVFVVVCLFLTYLFWSVSLVESGLEWRDWQSYPLVAGLLVFEFAVVLLLTVAFFSEQPRWFDERSFACLFGAVFTSVLWSPIGVKTLPYILLGFILYYLIVSYAKDLRAFIYPFLIISALNSLFAVLQKFGLQFIYETGRCDGMMFLSSHMAFYQALAVPICYMLNPWFAIIPLIGLVLSGSVFPLLVSILVMSWLLVKTKKNIFGLPFMGIYALFGIYFLLISKELIHKLLLRSAVWIKSFDFTLFGHGFGTFNINLPISGSSLTTYTIYGTVMHSMGILGFIALVYFISDKIFRYLKSEKYLALNCVFASFTTMTLCGLSQSFLDFPRLAFSSISVVAFLTLLLMKGELNGKT